MLYTLFRHKNIGPDSVRVPCPTPPGPPELQRQTGSTNAANGPRIASTHNGVPASQDGGIALCITPRRTTLTVEKSSKSFKARMHEKNHKKLHCQVLQQFNF